MVSLPNDFESFASTNFAIQGLPNYNTLLSNQNQDNFTNKQKKTVRQSFSFEPYETV